MHTTFSNFHLNEDAGTKMTHTGIHPVKTTQIHGRMFRTASK